MLFDFYLQYEYQLAQVQLVLFMLGMGATLTVADFAPVFQQPRALCYGLVFQLILTPLIAVLVNWLAGLEAGLAVGLLLVGTLPGGTLSNVFTYISRGHVALSIALSACATVLAIGTIPLLLNLLAAEYVPPNFKMPMLEIIREILLCMLLPLAVGMQLIRFGPTIAAPVSRWSMRLGFLLVVYMVIGSLGSGRVQPSQYGGRLLLTIVFFCVLTQQLSMLWLRLRGWPTGIWVAIGIEATIRNAYLGLLLTEILFPADNPQLAALGSDVLFVVLVYGAVSLGAVVPLTLRVRRKLQREAVAGAIVEKEACPAVAVQGETRG